MEFSWPKYWSGWPFPSPGDLPNPGMEPGSPELQADSLSAESQGKTFHKAIAAINSDSSDGAGKDHLKPSGKDSPF